ncbi:AAA family ATPase [Pararoseomonas sp. SCSIO 73927]|uniref:ATP-dependent nuclease n=1 Tax=Pararoseomonas sp. SCSIO 73927 TaxID=3114537 RepID=UPI0030D2C8F4
MKLVAFRVMNYRNIDDSGWIDLDRVTALVGRNESGKTTLLRALHKFNPATSDPYDAQREFPRDRYTTEYGRRSGWAVCQTRFKIEGEIVDTLSGILPDGSAVPQFAEATRFYDGSLAVGFQPPLASAEVSPGPLLEALVPLEKSTRRLKAATPDGATATSEAKTALLAWTTGAREVLNGVGNMRGEAGTKLLQRLRTELDALSDANTADLIEAFLEVLDHHTAEAKKPDPAAAARGAIRDALPVFIYFENYGVLDSAVWLTRFLEDAQADPSNPRIRTIKAMFSHVGLTAEDMQELGTDRLRVPRQGGSPTQEMLASEQRRKEERSIKLSSASSAITRLFGEWWSQRRHRIRYDADGDFFRIWVADNRRPDVEIELESRSKGFQWFFSFYLVFLVESEEGHKDAVLLLDEPGLNLHPTAQQELLAFFEKLSKDNQILYSTHSPFLVDGDNLQRVRPVVEGDDGHSRISPPGMWPKDRETIFPLQAAAGYAMVRGLLSMHRNVLVEGMTDFYLLHAISHRCRDLGLAHLPEDVHVVPCGGVPMVGKIASLFLGEGSRPVILLDGDQAGRGTRTNLQKDLYKGNESAVLLLDDVLGGEGNEVEDILGDTLYVAAVNEALGLALHVPPVDAGAAGSVIKRTMAAASAAGMDLPEGWKVTTSLYLVRSWAEGKAECPAEVARRGSTLFQALLERSAKPN